MRLQRLQYGPVVHGLQINPSTFAHAVVSGEDASGQRLRSELPLLVRQYPGSSGNVLKVLPDVVHMLSHLFPLVLKCQSIMLIELTDLVKFI